MAVRLFAALALLACSALAASVDPDVQVEEPFADYVTLPGLPNTYKLHKELMHWGPAAQKCQDELGHLVVINDLAESQGLFTLFNQVPSPGPGKQDLLHVGIYDSFSEGTWHAITGGLLADLDFASWATGRPVTSTLYNCGAITRAIQLTDIQCDSATYNLPFVCERETPPTTTTEATTTGATTATETTTAGTTAFLDVMDDEE